MGKAEYLRKMEKGELNLSSSGQLVLSEGDCMEIEIKSLTD